MKKTITLFLFAVLCVIGTANAQKSQSTPIDDLLNRLEQIGDNQGDISDFFTQEEQLQLRSHFSSKLTKTFSQDVGVGTYSGNNSFTSEGVTGPDILNGPPGTASNTKGSDVVITHSNTQTIEPGAEIACGITGVSMTDNWMYRAFDLANDFGIAGDFNVTDAEIAIGVGVVSPAGFPMDVNIYSGTSQDVDTATLTLLGSGSATITTADAETIVSVPVTATVPAGEIMVLEVVIYNSAIDHMRFGCNNDGETGPSWIMAPDCGANVPTKFADLGLTQGLVFNVVGDEGSTASGMAYCIENAAGMFSSFEVADGSVTTPIAASAVTGFENAGSVDPNDATTAYVIDNTGAAFSVDVATGVYTSMGTIGTGWMCGEFDPVSGNFYAIPDTDLGLYIIDFVGGTATLVGPTGSLGLPIGFAIDGAGMGYYYDLVDDSFYSVDLATGAATIVGPIGFDANFGQGMFWDDGTDTVYMTCFNSVLFDSEFRSVDTATGMTTLLTQMDSAALTQYGWSSAPAAGTPPIDCVESEDFEAGLPADWMTVVNTGTCDWQNGMDLPTGDDFPTNAMFFDDDACGVFGDPSNVTLLSAVYDTSGASYVTLGYDVAFQESGIQTFTVEVYDGAAWQQVALYEDDLDPDIQTESLDVSAHANADFQVRWTYDDNNGEWGWHAGVDNFCLDHDHGIGVADNTIEGFSYYPNPANDTINLNAQGNIGTVTIFNILGQTVVDQNIDATSTQINVSNLSMGTYVMKVSVDGQVGTYKVIKR